MNVDINDIGHAVRIMSGFESYMDNVDTSDRVYAKTCLRLNGVDLNAVAGNEGFMESIKAGGKKMVEMIMNLLRQIRDTFFGFLGSKKDKEIKEALSQATKFKVSVKQDLNEIKRYSNPELDKAVEAARASAERLERLMNGESFAINTKKWETALETYRKDLWDASSKAYYVERIPQVKITDMSFGASKLTDAIHKLQSATNDSTGKKRADDSYIVETLDEAGDLMELVAGVRTVAKEILAAVTIDLEHNTKGYKKLLELNDETLNERARAMQDLCTKMTKVSQGMTSLVAQCDNEVMVLFAGLDVISKALSKKNSAH